MNFKRNFQNQPVPCKREKRSTLQELNTPANNGSIADVDYLMSHLEPTPDFVLYKLIDHALGQVYNQEGRQRIRHYLFSGTQPQRNYAALYFKRLGDTDILKQAVAGGCIDEIQAFSK